MFKYKVLQSGQSHKIAFSRKAVIAIASSLASVLTQVAIGAAVSPAHSQSTPSQNDSETTEETTCAYDASASSPDPLGARASLTIEAARGDVAFVYERLPAIVSSDSSNQRAEVDNKRTLTLYDTSLEAARQLLIDDSTYYAVLLGLAPDDPFVAQGFERINQTLTCTTSSSEAGEATAPEPFVPPASPPPQPPASQPIR